MAFGQLFSPGFRSILFKSVGLTLGLFVLVWYAAKKLLDSVTFVSYPWLESTIDIVAALGLIAGMVFLIAPVTALVAGLFLASWSILQEQRAEDEEAAERYRVRIGPDGKARPLVAGIQSDDPIRQAQDS